MTLMMRLSLLRVGIVMSEVDIEAQAIVAEEMEALRQLIGRRPGIDGLFIVVLTDTNGNIYTNYFGDSNVDEPTNLIIGVNEVVNEFLRNLDNG